MRWVKKKERNGKIEIVAKTRIGERKGRRREESFEKWSGKWKRTKRKERERDERQKKESKLDRIRKKVIRMEGEKSLDRKIN